VVASCGVAREEVFVSRKLAAESKDYENAVDAIDGSLATLDIDYIDLMLIHRPQPWDDFRGGDYAAGNRAAWRALEEDHQAGKIRAISVSNFQQHELEKSLETCTDAPQENNIRV